MSLTFHIHLNRHESNVKITKNIIPGIHDIHYTLPRA